MCVYDTNIWIGLVKLPLFSPLLFSQLFKRVLRANRQVNGLPTFKKKTSFHLNEESWPHVCLISSCKHYEEGKSLIPVIFVCSYWCMCAEVMMENKLWISNSFWKITQLPSGSNQIFLSVRVGVLKSKAI